MLFERYLSKQVATTLLAVMGIMLTLMTANYMVKLSSQIASGFLSPGAFIELVLVYLPFIAAYVAPFALMISIIIAYGRMYADNELFIFFYSGLSWVRFYTISFVIVLIWSGVVALLVLWAMPNLRVLRDQVQRSTTSLSFVFDQIQPGQFFAMPRDQGVILARHKDSHGILRGIFVASKPKASLTSHSTPQWAVLTAKSAEKKHIYFDRGGKYNESEFVLFKNGVQYTPNQNSDNQALHDTMSFNRYLIKVDNEIQRSGVEYKRLSTMQLIQAVKYAKNTSEKAELFWRISIPFSVVLLGAMAIVLARVEPRKGRFSHLLSSIMIYIIYMNSILFARESMQISTMIFCHVTFFIFVVCLYIGRHSSFFKTKKG